jgi:hypothetical protein
MSDIPFSVNHRVLSHIEPRLSVKSPHASAVTTGFGIRVALRSNQTADSMVSPFPSRRDALGQNPIEGCHQIGGNQQQMLAQAVDVADFAALEQDEIGRAIFGQNI